MVLAPFLVLPDVGPGTLGPDSGNPRPKSREANLPDCGSSKLPKAKDAPGNSMKVFPADSVRKRSRDLFSGG
jgi:hypothetical protein